MLIADIMAYRVTAVSMDASLKLVRGILEESGFHYLPVVEGKRLMGMISDREMLKWVSPYVGTVAETDRDRDTLKKRAHQIMDRNLYCVRPETSIQAATAMLLKYHLAALPVVDQNRRLKGIVVWRDLLRYFNDQPPTHSLR
ncbi:MAG TPA: CBS domain-containing protein [Chromatiaceae bacterium]|nr:CBS domain-containing protein [Chromatiaceae bacterium]